MSKDTSQPQNSCDSQIPPPPDPFPTYQTPYPRSSPSSDDQNPFVLFKRFADTQLSSLFSDIPSLFGIAAKSNKNYSSSHLQPIAHDTQTSQQQLEYLKSSLAEIETAVDKWRAERFGDDEGWLKQLEQDWEERRMRIEQRMNDPEGRIGSERLNPEHTPRLPPNPADDLALYEHVFGPNNFFTHLPKNVENFHNATMRSPSKREDSSFPNSNRSNDIFDPVIGEWQAFLWWTNSPYSPLRLRFQDSQLNSNQRAAKLLDWDGAFQDLLHEETNSSDNKNEPANDSIWKTNLLHSYQAASRFKGLNGPIYASNIDHRRSANNWMAELDAALNTHWPKIWKDVRSIANKSEERHEAPSRPSAFNGNFSWSNADKTKPSDVLYNTTSTNTQRLPDGSIETRQVTTIGYRDGREESNEVVNIHPPRPQADAAVLEHIANGKSPGPEAEVQKPLSDLSRNETKKEARRAGKGWFWN